MLKLCGKQYPSSCCVQSTALDEIKVLKVPEHGLCYPSVLGDKLVCEVFVIQYGRFPHCTNECKVSVFRMNGSVH